MRLLTLLWKIPAAIFAMVVAALGASQAGWSGAELVADAIPMDILEEWVKAIIFILSVGLIIGSIICVYKIAKHALWVIGPILLYMIFVVGVWNGVLSDFDATRAYLLKTHYAANAYALDHMSARARYRTCNDEQIELEDDAKAVCVRAITAKPGEAILGSEHHCGLLGMFACYNTAPKKGFAP
jgi:hypothetical protein